MTGTRKADWDHSTRQLADIETREAGEGLAEATGARVSHRHRATGSLQVGADEPRIEYPAGGVGLTARQAFNLERQAIAKEHAAFIQAAEPEDEPEDTPPEPRETEG